MYPTNQNYEVVYRTEIMSWSPDEDHRASYWCLRDPNGFHFSLIGLDQQVVPPGSDRPECPVVLLDLAEALNHGRVLRLDRAGG